MAKLNLRESDFGYKSGDRYYGGLPAEPDYAGPPKRARYYKELIQYFKDKVKEYPEYYVIGTSPVAITLRTPDGKETIDLCKFDALSDAEEAIEMASHYFDESLFEAKKKKKNGALVNPDAGNVEHNIAMFNKMNSPVDGPCNNPVSGPFGGDVSTGAGMGEDFESCSDTSGQSDSSVSLAESAMTEHNEINAEGGQSLNYYRIGLICTFELYPAEDEVVTNQLDEFFIEDVGHEFATDELDTICNNIRVKNATDIFPTYTILKDSVYKNKSTFDILLKTSCADSAEVEYAVEKAVPSRELARNKKVLVNSHEVEVDVFMNFKFDTFGPCDKYGTYLDESFEDLTKADDKLNEAMPKKETIELEYKDLEFTQYGPQRDVDDWDEWDRCVDWTYEVDKDDIYTFIFESCIDETDFPLAFEDEFDPNNTEDWNKFEAWLDDNFDAIFSKYEQQILENWEERAAEEAAQEYDPNDYIDWDSMPGGHDYYEDIEEGEEVFMEKYSYGLNEEYTREPRMIDYFEQMNSEEDEA